ncbi:MAG: hypothetical protein Roseis2KO_34870 [Roseivirga sp.]
MTILLALAITCCKSEKSGEAKAFDPVGDWEYKVTTDVSYGVITITGDKGNYAGSMTTEVFGTLQIQALKIEGNTLTGDLDVGGTPAKIQCEFDGDEISGAVTAGADKFPFVGKRADE